jgi:hypothetical protein
MPYQGSRIFWNMGSQTTVFPSGGYARMIELKDGRLLAVAESGGICITFSFNNGESWSEPYFVFDAQHTFKEDNRPFSSSKEELPRIGSNRESCP